MPITGIFNKTELNERQISSVVEWAEAMVQWVEEVGVVWLEEEQEIVVVEWVGNGMGSGRGFTTTAQLQSKIDILQLQLNFTVIAQFFFYLVQFC